LRIAFSTAALNGQPVHPDCVQGVEDSAKLLTELGHHVFPGAPQFDMEQFTNAFVTLWAAGCAWAIKGLSKILGQKPAPHQFEPLTWGLYEMSLAQDPADYLLAVQTLQQISRLIAHFYQEVDLWLTPVVAEPPLPLGSFDSPPEDPLYGFRRAIDFVPFTPVANATGQPAMSVPLYWNKVGLPIGSHFIGRFGDEATLFRLAGQLEQVRPWANKRPPLSSGG
jgi:amidase